MTTLGHELCQRGHRVTFAGILDGQSKVKAAGLEFYPMGTSEFPRGAIAQSVTQLGQLSGLQAFRYTIERYKQSTTLLLSEAPNACREIGVDVLLIDQTFLGGATVAQYLDLPCISVCNALMLNREPDIPPFNTNWPYAATWRARLRNRAGYQLMTQLTRPITQVIAEYRQKWHLPALQSPNDHYSNLAQLCQQPAEFEYPRKILPSCFHFTGPYSNPISREPVPFPFEKLTGQPLIYASLGTIQNQLLDTFHIIAAACQELDAQLVIALGGGTSPESLPVLPGSPLVVGFAPQLDLLQRAALTITHAGMNTTLESLANGVPMVAIPIANDQPGVAARIAWTGTGEVVTLKRLSIAKLQPAIERVFTQDSYKQNAVRLQMAIQRAGGVQRAADIVEQVAATGKSIPFGYELNC
jgi:MGT family glycosyltransferase